MGESGCAGVGVGKGCGVTEQVDPRIVAGEFVLALADGDEVKAQGVLERVRSGEVSTVQLMAALARMAAEFLQLVAGERWRDELNAALLAISLEGEEES